MFQNVGKDQTKSYTRRARLCCMDGCSRYELEQQQRESAVPIDLCGLWKTGMNGDTHSNQLSKIDPDI